MKIALVQMKPVLHDKPKNLEMMHYHIQKASLQKCQLILFPELVLTGYFTREKTKELAEDINGESILQLKDWAREYNLMIIAGFPEKVEEEVFNSAVIIDQKGEIVGTYQKVHLWDEEEKYFSAGQNFPVWQTVFGTIGVMICYDTEFPETARILAEKGASIILAPTANMTPLEHLQKTYIQSRAAENQVFVATTNRIGVEETTHFFGQSAAANPFGELLVLGGGEENQYYVEVDFSEIKAARDKFCYLADRRPSVYQSAINRKGETIV
ncbi:carbon-nitrogen hydrolase family protein [Robertmurraya korlensis]|uniref:carbon-nitrogen hydrolase family protein n=1 Tax=Robertmurraya korlensis TaxID=519977 RepID=UPI0008246B5E|nr:carbon-nitrogen hydrolase family protein [Robertmurraya korlensis]